MNDITLPPLPKSHRPAGCTTDLYTADQMRDYATTAVLADREARGEPVAWTTMPDADDWDFVSVSNDPNGKLPGKWYPLYAAPQPVEKRQPLTDEQIAQIANTPVAVIGSYVNTFARAIERAHGIGGKA